jgi:hypothetical protein
VFVRVPTWPLALALTALVMSTASLGAQQPQDSLAERVRRAEEAIQQLRAQLERQAPPPVRTRSRHALELYGLILANGFYNSAKANNSDIPLYADTATADDPLGLPTSNVGAAVRQTRLGLTVSEVRALGATVTGALEVDFFGGQLPSAAGRTSPLLRLRIATVRLDWAHVRLLAGQDWTLLAPQNALSFAALGAPQFASSGNLWARAPQARLTAETEGRTHLGVQGAVLAPMQPRAQGFLATQPDSAERSGRPSAEGRVYLAWGNGETTSEIGVAGHWGWLATATDTLLASRAIAADARIALGRHLVLSGEAYSGRGLGAFGGAVGQNLGVGGVPVRALGGWVQADVRPGPGWQFGGGYGIDDPNDDDLGLNGRGRNVTYATHLIWRPAGGLLFGTEFRRIETTYARGTLAVNHVNAYVGLAF